MASLLLLDPDELDRSGTLHVTDAEWEYLENQLNQETEDD